ncbi:hypothetical protein BH10PSE11_BH10PSE11_24330 [soil metagenome]
MASSRILNPLGMWETNTLNASMGARLNVAKPAICCYKLS